MHLNRNSHYNINDSRLYHLIVNPKNEKRRIYVKILVIKLRCE